MAGWWWASLSDNAGDGDGRIDTGAMVTRGGGHRQRWTMVGQASGWAPSSDNAGDGGGCSIVDNTGDGDGGWWVSDDAGDGGGHVAIDWGWSSWLSLGMGVVVLSPSMLGMVIVIVVGRRWRWWRGDHHRRRRWWPRRQC